MRRVSMFVMSSGVEIFLTVLWLTMKDSSTPIGMRKAVIEA